MVSSFDVARTPMATVVTCQTSVQQLKTKTDTSMTRHVHKTCLELSTMISVSTYRKTISSITHCQMLMLLRQVIHATAALAHTLAAIAQWLATDEDCCQRL